MAEQTVSIQLGGNRICTQIRGYMTVDKIDEDLAESPWFLSRQGYAVRNSKERPNFRYAHRAIMERVLGRGLVDDEQVDHANHHRTDNRRCNLRLVTKAQNMQNRRGLDRNNTSGYRGVAWDAERQKWMAKVKHNGTSYFLGRFDDAALAGAVASAARERLGFLTPVG